MIYIQIYSILQEPQLIALNLYVADPMYLLKLIHLEKQAIGVQ